MVALLRRPLRTLSQTVSSNCDLGQTLDIRACSTSDFLSRADRILIRLSRPGRHKRLRLDPETFRQLSLLVRLRLENSILRLDELKSKIQKDRLTITQQEKERHLQIIQLARERSRTRYEGMAKIMRANENLLATRRRNIGKLEQEKIRLEQEIPKLRELQGRVSRLEGEDEAAPKGSEEPK
jgi:hypothetical protein